MLLFLPLLPVIEVTVAAAVATADADDADDAAAADDGDVVKSIILRRCGSGSKQKKYFNVGTSSHRNRTRH